MMHRSSKSTIHYYWRLCVFFCPTFSYYEIDLFAILGDWR